LAKAGKQSHTCATTTSTVVQGSSQFAKWPNFSARSWTRHRPRLQLRDFDFMCKAEQCRISLRAVTDRASQALSRTGTAEEGCYNPPLTWMFWHTDFGAA